MSRNPLPKEVIGIGIVWNAIGQVLIDQRLPEGLLGGLWEFPGGKQEPNESIQTTVEREIKEELGILIDVGEKLVSFSHSYSHKKIQFEVFICNLIAGKPKPLASQQVKWVHPDDLSEYPFPSANSKIIKALRNAS